MHGDDCTKYIIIEIVHTNPGSLAHVSTIWLSIVAEYHAEVDTFKIYFSILIIIPRRPHLPPSPPVAPAHRLPPLLAPPSPSRSLIPSPLARFPQLRAPARRPYGYHGSNCAHQRARAPTCPHAPPARPRVRPRASAPREEGVIVWLRAGNASPCCWQAAKAAGWGPSRAGGPSRRCPTAASTGSSTFRSRTAPTRASTWWASLPSTNPSCSTPTSAPARRGTSTPPRGAPTC